MKRWLSTILLLFLMFAPNGLYADGAQDAQQVEKLKIKKKPAARAPRGGSCASEGITLVKVTFDRSAKVTNVEVKESSGCDLFDRNVVAAAMKIEFTPQKENGEAVTIVRQVIYKYTFY